MFYNVFALRLDRQKKIVPIKGVPGAVEVEETFTADTRGDAESTGHGQRAGTAAYAESERGVRVPPEDNTHPAVRQTVKNSNPQVGHPVHRLPVPGAAQSQRGRGAARRAPGTPGFRFTAIHR